MLRMGYKEARVKPQDELGGDPLRASDRGWVTSTR